MSYKELISDTFEDKNKFVHIMDKKFFDGALIKQEFNGTNGTNKKVEYNLIPPAKYLTDYKFSIRKKCDSSTRIIDKIDFDKEKIVYSDGAEYELLDKIKRILITTYDNVTRFYRIRIEHDENSVFEFYGNIELYDFSFRAKNKKIVVLSLSTPTSLNSINLVIQKDIADVSSISSDDSKWYKNSLDEKSSIWKDFSRSIDEQLFKCLEQEKKEEALKGKITADWGDISGNIIVNNVSDLNCNNVNKKIINNNKESKMKDKFNSLMPQRVYGGIAMAMNGKVAVKVGDSNFVSYNSDTKQIEDHMDFTFGEDRISEFCFLMPVDLKALKVGDIVSTNSGYGFITEVDSESGDVTCVNATDATKADLVPVKNVFTNTAMVKKLITLFDNMNTQAGGMNPMMFMLMGKDKDGKSGNDDMLKMMLMSQMMGANGGANGINPMMFMMM